MMGRKYVVKGYLTYFPSGGGGGGGGGGLRI